MAGRARREWGGRREWRRSWCTWLCVAPDAGAAVGWFYGMSPHGLKSWRRLQAHPYSCDGPQRRVRGTLRVMVRTGEVSWSVYSGGTVCSRSRFLLMTAAESMMHLFIGTESVLRPTLRNCYPRGRSPRERARVVLWSCFLFMTSGLQRLRFTVSLGLTTG